MKRILHALLTIPLALAILACEDEQAPESAPETAQEPVPGTPGEPVVMDRAEGPIDLEAQYLVRLSPVRGTAPTGTVAFSPAGDQTRADVAIEAAATEGIHEGSIQVGTRCEALGGEVAELPPITVHGDGSGTGSGTIGRPMTEIMDGNTVAVYYASGRATDEPVLCGAIPLMPPEVP